VRLAVLTIALLFIAALAVLTVRDIRTYGFTPLDVPAVIVVLVFATGILGALIHHPRR
jgi:heme A synthase